MAEHIGMDRSFISDPGKWQGGSLYPQPGSDRSRLRYNDFSVDVADLSLKAARATAQSCCDSRQPSSASRPARNRTENGRRADCMRCARRTCDRRGRCCMDRDSLHDSWRWTVDDLLLDFGIGLSRFG